MSKLGSKEEILSAIQLHFENIQSGNLTADDMESLVELTRELHERALILRYKSYEEKIFGVAPTSSASTNQDQSVAEPETEETAEEAPAETTSAQPVEVETQHSIGFEEVETAILAAEPSIPVEEPVFDFDMFEKAEAASEVEQPPINEVEQTSAEEKQAEIQPDPSDAEPNVIQQAQNAEQPEAKFQPETIIPETEAQQIANEVEESPVTVSQQMPFETYQPTETVQVEETAPKAEEKQAEIPLPEELAIMNEPVIVPEKTPEVRPQAEENDMFRRFSNNSDDSLSSRLSATKLHTLAGAFGLNEKLQCIRELFKGSSEAFNQAIENLDQQENFAAAKRILAQYAQQNSWNLESNLTAEFIQKVERRFL